MKNKYLFMTLIIAVVILFPVGAKAECSTKRLAELNNIASNVKLSYTYNIGNSGAEFQIKINNMTNDLYVSNSMNEKQYFGNGEITDSYIYNSGLSLIYTIYSNDNACKGEALTNKYLSLPYFNNFSTLKECEENPEFKYCKKWSNTTSLQMSDFDKALKEYKKSGKKNETAEEEKMSWWDSYKYYVYVGSAIAILAIIAGIVIVIDKRKKRVL